ncbi:MAG: hypothetical protein QXU40_01970 [Candidatus Pacearchaeota archaeon]
MIFIILAMMSVVTAQTYSRSFVDSTPRLENTFFGDYSRVFDIQKCYEGQDFLLYIPPTGCVPSVVRSDLLEEQNVPVFCPIMATKLNPLISVDRIRGISFKGSYPKEVSGVGYYPARSALGIIDIPTGGFANNLGYAVIVLRKQKNEEEMPKFVEGNLTATINYDAEHVFGVGGDGVFYLPVLSNEEWETKLAKYGFWRGKGYLRAEGIDEDGKGAIISLYSDVGISGSGKPDKRVVFKGHIKVKESSESIFIPGFDYCSGRLRIKLDDIEVADTHVRLYVNGDPIYLKKGEWFIDNKCQITSIRKDGVFKSVSGFCEEDSGRKGFSLEIKPKVKIKVEGEEGSNEYGVGDKINVNSQEFSIVKIYTNKDTGKEEDLVVEISPVLDQRQSPRQETEIYTLKMGEGGKVSIPKKEESSVTLILEGFSVPKNMDIGNYSDYIKGNYTRAIESYREVLKGFASEKVPTLSEKETLGERALNEMIKLSYKLGQKRDTFNFCEDFKERYPSSEVPDECLSKEIISNEQINSHSVIINRRIYTFYLEDIIEPTFEEYGAEIIIKKDNKESRVELLKNKPTYLNINDKSFYIELLNIYKNLEKEESVRINTNIFGTSQTFLLKKDSPFSKEGYTFLVKKVNLKKVAKVSLISEMNKQYTTATIPFKIGIEKRSNLMKLSPEKTEELIKKLNYSISKWEEFNEKLRDVVRIGKTACLATAVTLITKNLVEDLAGGEGVVAEKGVENLASKKPYEGVWKEGKEIIYYEEGKYKGIPKFIPLSQGGRKNDGWYIAIQPGTEPLITESGMISYFWICNIGQNGRPEFFSENHGDDICVLVSKEDVPIPYLSKDEGKNIINEARTSVLEVMREYVEKIRDKKVGEPSLLECKDLMSEKDCKVLFNVCDPFICPSSRCNLGGTYQVGDVIQSGIAGSIFLCLPNFPEVIVPICISGIHAGVDGYISVMKSYKECLQTSLATGDKVGICDRLHSVYSCEFFWRQLIPVIEYSYSYLKKGAFGKGAKGGGEYLNPNAFEKAEKSFNYFVNYYATNSFRVFRTRTLEGVGTEFCRKWISLPGAKAEAVLGALISPESPPQFFGNFDEIPFTTATVPPISHYKVFYHIYAGRDLPAYYEVYLRGEPSSFYQDIAYKRIVARGFIPVGERKSETIDFTAPSGYRQLCIVVNNQEECGFKQVTTDFALQYLSDSYIRNKINQTRITKSSECVSGSFDLTDPLFQTILNFNVQSGVESSINQDIYKKGIVRVCSTSNPGLNTDPYINTNKQRWVEVGYCDDMNTKCWLDRESIKDAIKIFPVEKGAIKDIENNLLESLSKTLTSESGFFSEDSFNAFISEIKGEINKGDDLKGKINKINEIDQNLDRVFYSYHKGYLIFMKGELYHKIVDVELTKTNSNKEPTQTKK